MSSRTGIVGVLIAGLLVGCGSDSDGGSLALPDGPPTDCTDVAEYNLAIAQARLTAWDDAGITFTEVQAAEDDPEAAADMEARVEDVLPAGYFERASEALGATASLDCDEAEIDAYMCNNADQLEAKGSGSGFLLAEFVDFC